MSRLTRSFPIGKMNDVREYQSSGVQLKEERDLSILRITAREISKELDAHLATLVGNKRAVSPNEVLGDSTVIAALSRRERLVLGNEAEVRRLALGICKATTGMPLIVDVTHQFAVIELSGRSANEVLSSLTPLSFDKAREEAGRCLRTTFAGTVVFVHVRPRGESYRLLFDQSLSDFTWGALEDAANNAILAH